jgi:hypothetical protein
MKKELWSGIILIVVGVLLLAGALMSFRSGHFNADRFGHRLITAKDDPYQFWTVVGAWSVLGACAIYAGIVRWRR